jgi:hypothetical protein
VRLSVISASVTSVPWMRIDTCCLEPRVVSVRFAENGPPDATAWIEAPAIAAMAAHHSGDRDHECEGHPLRPEVESVEPCARPTRRRPEVLRVQPRLSALTVLALCERLDREWL